MLVNQTQLTIVTLIKFKVNVLYNLTIKLYNLTLANKITGTLIACIVHNTLVGVCPLTKTATMAEYTARKEAALPVAPP